MGGLVRRVWVASLSATLIVLFLCRRHPKASNFLILTALFQLGAWLSAQAEAGLHRLLPKEKVCYEAVVMSEPVPRGKVVRFDMAVLQHQGKPLLVKAQLLRDTISHRYDRLHVGDGLRAVSILETPQRWAASTFDYVRWLRLHGFSARPSSFPPTGRRPASPCNPWAGGIASCSRRAKSVNTSWTATASGRSVAMRLPSLLPSRLATRAVCRSAFATTIAGRVWPMSWLSPASTSASSVASSLSSRAADPAAGYPRCSPLPVPGPLLC